MKFADGEEKGILRKAFAEALPDAILHRKKILIRKPIIRIMPN